MSVDLAYIFPDVLPDDGVVLPLPLLFTQVLFLRPVEDDLPEADTPLVREMLGQQERSRCIAYTCPAPLGEDRERFLALLQDIRLRPEDYAGHLGNLSAGLGHVVREDEREHSIIDTLLQQSGIRAGSGEHTPEPEKGQEKNVFSVRLWQARLLLKLGESMDRNQAEIRRNLDRMRQQQEMLFRELRREEDGDLPDLELPTSGPGDEIPFQQQRLRLKAWSRLFALHQQSFAGTAFISRSPDAVEALLEQYRQGHSSPAKPLLILPLPGFYSEEDGAFLRREHFQEEAGALIAAIRAFLTASAASAFSEDMQEAWIDLLEGHYPEKEHGRCTLTLYFLSEVRPQQLFLETFASQDESSVTLASETAEAGMVLGLLES
ncbi:MAG: hypothetical protein WGN25_09945 [Candidatus Electrothrix sp. GW3-4]|uniref:hypothetical protein n=1 Tax=Candidatus Electrothrix sp. GW3-4 TaxID=3126740 RepID=UPI0030CDE315